MRNELLVKLAYTSYGAIAVADIIASNFHQLPENVDKLLFKLADDFYGEIEVSRVVVSNFDKLLNML